MPLLLQPLQASARLDPLRGDEEAEGNRHQQDQDYDAPNLGLGPSLQGQGITYKLPENRKV